MIATNVCMKMKKIVILLLGVLLSLAAEAQTTITGRITDARTGESLIGASLVPKNSGELGAVTDIEGNFTLQTNVKLPLTLSVQYVGYRTLDVDVYDAEEPLEIQLVPGGNRLSEVVVVGYGVQKRQELTSSISTVGEELLNQNISSVESVLQGSVAGINVTTSSGQPGATSTPSASVEATPSRVATNLFTLSMALLFITTPPLPAPMQGDPMLRSIPCRS